MSQSSGPTPVRRRRARAARPFTVVETLLIVVLIVLVGAIAWFALRSGDDDAGTQQAGPGEVKNAAGDMTFYVYDGWTVTRADGQTRVTHDAGEWPAFELQPLSLEQIGLVTNWSCFILPDRAAGIAAEAARTLGLDAALTYAFAPDCDADASAPVYVLAYLALTGDPDQQVMFVLGPLDGQTWVLAHTDPFSFAPSQDMQDAIIDAVVSVRRVE